MADVTKWPAVVDALVTGLRARTGYRPTTAAGVGVYDGPEAGNAEDAEATFLVIGWPGDPDDVRDSGSSGQAMSTLGNRARDEDGLVRCFVSSTQNTVKAARDAAFGVLADVETWLRADPTIALTVGGASGTAYLMAVIDGAGVITQYVTDAGCTCDVEFDITYQARI